MLDFCCASVSVLVLLLRTHLSIESWFIRASSWENVSSGVSDQVRIKLACSATEASMRVEILITETRDISLSRQRTTKALIRLRGCAGWSAPLLFAYDIRHVSLWPGSYVYFLMHWWVWNPSRGPNNVYVLYEPQQKPWRGVRKTNYNPPPPLPPIPHPPPSYSNCHYFSTFC